MTRLTHSRLRFILPLLVLACAALALAGSAWASLTWEPMSMTGSWHATKGAEAGQTPVIHIELKVTWQSNGTGTRDVSCSVVRHSEDHVAADGYYLGTCYFSDSPSGGNYTGTIYCPYVELFGISHEWDFTQTYTFKCTPKTGYYIHIGPVAQNYFKDLHYYSGY